MIKAAKSADAKDPLRLAGTAIGLGVQGELQDGDRGSGECIRKNDVLVKNAAEQHKSHSIEEIDEQRLERVFRTNVFSYFFMCKYALNRLTEGSSIINTTPVVAYRGSPKLLDYTTTKCAIVSFIRGLALHLVNRGIRGVNGVAMGPIWTSLIPASFNEEEVAKFGSQVPMKRAGQPFEVAPSYVFLACNGGEIVNG